MRFWYLDQKTFANISLRFEFVFRCDFSPAQKVNPRPPPCLMLLTDMEEYMKYQQQLLQYALSTSNVSSTQHHLPPAPHNLIAALSNPPLSLCLKNNNENILSRNHPAFPLKPRRLSAESRITLSNFTSSLNTQETTATSTQSSQHSPPQKPVECEACGRQYKLKSSLLNHKRWECGKEPQFKCVLCSYAAKQKAHLLTHIKFKHK